jgi:hypothetical protein
VVYKSKGKEFDQDISQSASTYGLSATLGFDYRIVKFLYIGISANIFMASIKELNSNGATVKNNEGLTHADFGGGLRFCF